jgi:formylglycine-generating enzyme required for sulfatase activity
MRFDREVEALAKLDHPGIVGILDRGRTDDGTPFLVMDFIQGEDLDAYLRQRSEGEWHVKQVVRLFASIAATVYDAHVQGVVHRDLKPSNVRVDGRGQTHVLDFGLAQLMDADDGGAQMLTTTGHLVGSLPWTSPEQVSRSSVGPLCDVYALGVMLYQALTDQYPYPVVGGLHEIIGNIRDASPAPPEKVKNPPFGRVDGALTAVILKALAKRPQDRYPSAAALAADLEAYCLDRPTSVAEAAGPRRSGVIAAILCCVFFVGVGALAFFHTRERPVVASDLPIFTNELGMTFVRVPSGNMAMGSPYHEAGRDEDEDYHPVQMTRGYFISTTEVTRVQYKRVMGALPAGCNPAASDDAPVDHVTYLEAEEFCRRLGGFDPERRTYSLPSEAQWEYAGRAGANGPFAGSGDVELMGWYARNAKGKLQPVASKQRNHWGLYDVHGNVAEWCRDSYRGNLGLVARVDPVNTAQERSRAPEEIGRVVRGGGVLDGWQDCRSASRQSSPADVRRAGLGFRIVVVEEPAKDVVPDPR